jgi:hypothetical protein
MTTTSTAAGQSRVEEGQGAVRPAICAAGVPVAHMACGVDQGTSILEESNILANWAMDISGAVGGGGGNSAGEADDILGAIAGSGGGSGAVASTLGRRQWRLPNPPHLPSLGSWTSLSRDVMARLLLSSSQSLLPLSSLGGRGRWRPLANVRVHIMQVLQHVLGACQAAIGAAGEWGGGGCPPCGESGGGDNIDDINDKNNNRDI